MKRSQEIRDLFLPWTGLVVGIVAAGFAHQFGSEGTFNECRDAAPIPVLIVCALAIITCAAAGWASWTVARNRSEGQARRLVGIISVAAAALLIMATLLPMIAALLLPPCFQ